MTSEEMALKRIVSGLGFLPVPDQYRFYRCVGVLRDIFRNGSARSAEIRQGLELIGDGFKTLGLRLLAGAALPGGIDAKIANILKILQAKHPEIIAAFNRANEGG
jgi:hypothetical protein